MRECIHEMAPEQCDTCSATTGTGRRSGVGATGGKRFALIHAPALRPETFVHLNVEGDRWKIRWYVSRSSPPVELAGTGVPSSDAPIDLASTPILQELHYPHSTSPSGTPVTDSRYWFDEIERMNARHLAR